MQAPLLHLGEMDEHQRRPFAARPERAAQTRQHLIVRQPPHALDLIPDVHATRYHAFFRSPE